MTPYKYSSLDSARSEVRVLALLPSSNLDEDIHCSLETVSLDENPHFEALSYVWATPTPTHDLFVDGVPFTIGPNLFAALHAVRLREKPRALWVDAICIDQRSVEDQSYHVHLMERILSQATPIQPNQAKGLAASVSDSIQIMNANVRRVEIRGDSLDDLVIGNPSQTEKLAASISDSIQIMNANIRREQMRGDSLDNLGTGNPGQAERLAASVSDSVQTMNANVLRVQLRGDRLDRL